MDLHESLRSRRSIRRFENRPIPREVVERILTTATFAPSAHNRQPWRFAVVSTGAIKTNLADAMAAEYYSDLQRDRLDSEQIEALITKSRFRITSAPLLVVLCMDSSEMDAYPDARRAEAERNMALQSTANAGVMLLLAAHAEGLGGVWNCAPLFAPDAVARALDLPATWIPQALMLIGPSAETPPQRSRKPIESVAIFR